MTSRIMQHSSSQRRVIFFVRMGWPRAFLGKSPRKLLLHVQETFQKPNTLGTRGFFDRVRRGASSPSAAGRHVLGRDTSGEAGHFLRLIRKRKRRKNGTLGRNQRSLSRNANSYHPVDKMSFNLSLMKSQAINISKDKRRHKYMYSSFTWA